MSVSVAEHAARSIAEFGKSVEVIWHGGEPLSCQLKHFSALVKPFEALRAQNLISHQIQTNATLINESWCDFFRAHEFRIGVSIDGPSWANTKRVDWNDNQAFDRIIRGIHQLLKADIPFSAICVAQGQTLDRAQELYDFFANLGCHLLGINIEEQLGTHLVPLRVRGEDTKVITFWHELFNALQRKPVIKIREFSHVLPSLTTLDGESPEQLGRYDIFPSIAWNGDVVFLAPEFLNTHAPQYDNFVIGNILKEDLDSIVRRGEKSGYVNDFVRGITRCKTECEYFPLCYGGQAGNKFFEHGHLDVTETVFCKNSVKKLTEGVLRGLECRVA